MARDLERLYKLTEKIMIKQPRDQVVTLSRLKRMLEHVLKAPLADTPKNHPTAGLQFSSKPTTRAWEAGEVLDKCILHQEGDYVLDEDDWGIILEALQLMTEERR